MKDSSSRLLPLTSGVGQLLSAVLSAPVAGRTYPTPKARDRGREGQPHLQGAVAAWVQEGLKELFKVRRGSGEEIPLIQGKEQWLCYAGAAMKTYPTPKIRETQVRR